MREYKLKVNDKEFTAKLKEITSEHALIVVNDQEYKVEMEDIGGMAAPQPTARPASRPKANTQSLPEKEVPRTDDSSVQAPLPGLILEILVKEGDSIKAGQDLLVMEAMKMENKVQAPYDGKVKKLNVQPGANVSEGDVLLEIARPLMTTV